MDDEFFDDMGYTAGHTVFLDEPLPVGTGVLRPDGTEIMRHPVVPRFGFHPKGQQHHVPTLDGEPYEQAIGGWAYESD